MIEEENIGEDEVATTSQGEMENHGEPKDHNGGSEEPALSDLTTDTTKPGNEVEVAGPKPSKGRRAKSMRQETPESPLTKPGNPAPGENVGRPETRKLGTWCETMERMRRGLEAAFGIAFDPQKVPLEQDRKEISRHLGAITEALAVIEREKTEMKVRTRTVPELVRTVVQEALGSPKIYEMITEGIIKLAVPRCLEIIEGHIGYANGADLAPGTTMPLGVNEKRMKEPEG